MDDHPNTLIESLGIYLPPKSISTSDVLQSCIKQIRFPLEKITGISSRRMAGQNEFAIDLARNAIANCLEKSKYHPADIDVLVCCNISRYDGLKSLAFEPSTSIKLKEYFGFSNAIVFDISNACAGMFTGIYIVDGLLKTGTIQRGMVVSGEYITHLIGNAQKEIESYLDSRLACLTLGDAGAALVLETGTDNHTGFHEIDLQTLGRYSHHCIAKQSETGGWVMYTDSVIMTDVAIKYGTNYALRVLERAGWPPDTIQHLIMHQTSRMSLNSAMREINNLLKDKIFHDGNTINNLEERGNTASTSHIIAIADQIHNNNIQSDDKVVFSINASGLTVGTALYVFDDLPDRLRQTGLQKLPDTKNFSSTHQSLDGHVVVSGIRIESVGIIPEGTKENMNFIDLLHCAAIKCLENSFYQCNDIELLIHCGVYRNEYTMEPACAALLAGKLDMNAALSDQEGSKTFAFDIFNGSVGFMNACYIAQQMIMAGNCKSAMVVASEIENNAELYPDKLLGVRETASAIILDAHPKKDKGFFNILFNYHAGSLEAYTADCLVVDSKLYLQIEKDPDLEEKYIACIRPVVEELMQKEGIALNKVDMVFPPQISSGFITRLSKQLDLPWKKFVDVVGKGPDIFTSSIPYGIKYALERELVKPGDTGLMIAVGSGIQAGCTIYQF